jgi:hypothetical protein
MRIMPGALNGASTVQLAELILTDSDYRPGGSSARICHATGPSRQPYGLYKEYNKRMLDGLNQESLARLVRWRVGLGLADREFLDSFCALPHTLVCDGDQVVGILMQEAPAAFQWGIPGRPLQPRHAEALGRRHRDDRRREVDYFPPPHKIALLGVLLQRLIWLHDHDVVVSDLHPRNTLITADIGRRDIYLLDCDAFWLGDDHAFPPHAPEMWQVGDGNSATRATDLAKFAMLTTRAVNEDFANPGFSAEKLLRVLPSHHVRLLRRMYSVDPDLRSETLRSMAYSWTRMVKSRTMFIWTDEAGRVPWMADPAASTAPQPAAPPAAEPGRPPEWTPPAAQPSAQPEWVPPQRVFQPDPAPSPAGQDPWPARHDFRSLSTVAVILVVIGVLLVLGWVFGG